MESITINADLREVTINKGKYAGTKYRYYPGVSINPENLNVDFGYEFLENPHNIEEADPEWVHYIGDILMFKILGESSEIELE